MMETRTVRIVRWLVLTLLAAFTALPMLVMAVTSVRPATAVRGTFAWWPADFTASAYAEMWSTIPYARYLTNSLIVAGCGALLALLVAVPAGYALARWRFRGRNAVAVGILATQIVPGMTFVVPLFLLFGWLQAQLGIRFVGSYLGLILTDLCFAVPFAVWMLARYFALLPVEVEQAAQVDGAGRWTVLVRIAVPIARPAIVAVGVLAFTIAWGEVLFASVLSDVNTRTLAVGLADYAAGSAPQWNTLMAAAITAAVPAVLAFGYLQRVWLPVSVPDSSSGRDVGPRSTRRNARRPDPRPPGPARLPTRPTAPW